MNKPFRTLSALALTLSLAGGLIGAAHAADATAPTTPAAGATKPGEERKELIKSLNLTPDQKAKMKVIMADAKTERDALKADTTLDPKAKKMKGREIMKETNDKIEAILTAEQKATYEAGLAKMKAERGAKQK